MATPSKTDSTPETRQANFEQGVAFALHLWPALSLAVQNNWGGAASSDKRDWFAGAVAEMFPSFVELAKPASQRSQEQQVLEEPDLEDVETTLLQVMLDEFDVNVDDDTGFETAELIARVRSQCAKDNFEEVDSLRKRWEASKGKKIAMKEAEDADQDTDWESDDDEEDDDDADVDMNDAPAPAQVRKEKAPPEVDEDGFTKVTKKR